MEKRMFGSLSVSPVKSAGGEDVDTSCTEDLVKRVHLLEENVGALTGSTALTDVKLKELSNAVVDLKNEVHLCFQDIQSVRLEMQKLVRDVQSAVRRNS